MNHISPEGLALLRRMTVLLRERLGQATNVSCRWRYAGSGKVLWHAEAKTDIAGSFAVRETDMEALRALASVCGLRVGDDGSPIDPMAEARDLVETQRNLMHANRLVDSYGAALSLIGLAAGATEGADVHRIVDAVTSRITTIHLVGSAQNADAVSMCKSASERIPHPSFCDDVRDATCIPCLLAVLARAEADAEGARVRYDNLVSLDPKEREEVVAMITARRKRLADVTAQIRHADASIAEKIGDAIANERSQMLEFIKRSLAGGE